MGVYVIRYWILIHIISDSSFQVYKLKIIENKLLVANSQSFQIYSSTTTYFLTIFKSYPNALIILQNDARDGFTNFFSILDIDCCLFPVICANCVCVICCSFLILIISCINLYSFLLSSHCFANSASFVSYFQLTLLF